MRFLKKKIARAKASQSWLQLQNRVLHRNQKQCNNQEKHIEDISSRKPQRIPGFRLAPESSRATKNIVKNYGKAICNFSNSSISSPYLSVFAEKEGVKIEGFINYVNSIKGKIYGLHHFRSILISRKEDNEELAAYKRVFKSVSEVFIKYFSVNWIFHSRIFHKEAHVKFRFKMLRRIKNPELFTYLKATKRSTKKRSRACTIEKFI